MARGEGYRDLAPPIVEHTRSRIPGLRVVLLGRDPKTIGGVVELIFLQSVGDAEGCAFAELADHGLARHGLVMNHWLELTVATGFGDFTIDADGEEGRGIELNDGLDGCRAADTVVGRFRTRAIGEDGDPDGGPGLGH